AEEAMHQAKARGGNSVGVYYRERRNYIRFDVSRRQMSIRIQATDRATSIESGESEKTPLNISRSGLPFEGDRPFAIGDEVIIVCESARDHGRVTLRARIVRLEEIEAEPKRFEVGAIFLLEWDHQEAQVSEFLRRGGLAAS